MQTLGLVIDRHVFPSLLVEQTPYCQNRDRHFPANHGNSPGAEHEFLPKRWLPKNTVRIDCVDFLVKVVAW